MSIKDYEKLESFRIFEVNRIKDYKKIGTYVDYKYIEELLERYEDLIKKLRKK